LYDFQQGTRHGEMAAAMRNVAKQLSARDEVDLVAYAASLPAR